MLIQKPLAGEFNPYYGKYIDVVPDGNVVDILRKAQASTVAFLQGLPADSWASRYAEGKWALAEVVLHVIDTERIMAYRALRIARHDSTPLPGFEQDDYVPHSKATERAAEGIIAEYKAVRGATLSLLEHLPEAAFGFLGTASEATVSVRALAYIMAGHEMHHLGVLEQRYL